MAPIAVTLLTGFLGAGKTTLLRHILNEQHGFKIAVIENEFGEVSVDDQLIGDRATQIKTLTNGCICCTRSNELEDALLDLLDSRDRGEIEFDRLVIECTGMADPGPIIQTFFSHEVLCERYLLDGVIALVLVGCVSTLSMWCSRLPGLMPPILRKCASRCCCVSVSVI